jgi:hypothetical protein
VGGHLRGLNEWFLDCLYGISYIGIEERDGSKMKKQMKPRAEVKSVLINIRVTKRERLLLQVVAEENGTSYSEYLRKLISMKIVLKRSNPVGTLQFAKRGIELETK